MLLFFKLFLNDSKDFADFISVGRLFQSKAPLCAKQLWARVVFNRGGLRFILALRIVLPVITETLLNRTDKYSGAWLLIALYTMPTVSCCIIS